MTEHSGTWLPEDRAASRYHYLPVDVPAGAAGLRVALEYDRSAGVLDLGVFDPAGRFRGWSGASRESFAVTREWATPGYLPGELPAGEWRVLLGLHRVPPPGLAFSLTAETGRVDPPAASLPVETALSAEMAPAGMAPGPSPAPDPPAERPSQRRGLPTTGGLTWLAGDLHAHTEHSDGTLRVDQLAALAAASGLDFLAVTDHNTVSHHPALPRAGARAGVVLIPGQEVTTDRGHANAFGNIGWVDFRRPAADWVSTVASRGGLLSINHPLGSDCAWRHPLAQRPPLAEVWHSGWWDRTWGAPLAWLQAWGADTIPVGGSDFHNPAQHARLGQPTTWVACPDRSAAGVLDGLAAGRVAISADPDGPLLVPAGEDLLALDADGALLADTTGRRRVVRGDRATFPAGPGLHWLEDHRTQILAICRTG